ncbi:hypothetical protein EU528_12020, partial [Candidatus Thorarchaeota archaeon]
MCGIRMKRITVLTLIFILLVLPIISIDTIEPAIITNIESKGNLSYTPNPNIYVDEFADFATEGFLGSGTVGAPFYIDDLIFNSTGNLIEIRDTDAYVEIRNCYFTKNAAAPSTIGIYLYNASHVTVKNCIFFNISSVADVNWFSTDFTLVDCVSNGTSGAYVDAWVSPNVNITGNTLDGVYDGGQITIDFCNDSFIFDNTLNSAHIGVEHSNGTIVRENDIDHDFISVYESKGVFVQDNNLIGNLGYPAIQMHTCTNCTVENNEASDYLDSDGTYYVTQSVEIVLVNNSAQLDGFATNADFGFNVEHSSQCHLENNTADGFLHSGFRFYNVSDTDVHNNTAVDNDYWGFSADESYRLEFTNCTAHNNPKRGFGIYDSNETYIGHCVSIENGNDGYYIINCLDTSMFYCNAILNEYCGFVLSGGSNNLLWDC